MTIVRIPTTLRLLTAGQSEVQMPSGSITEVLDHLEAAHPGFRDRIFDANGNLRRYVNIYAGEEDVRFIDGGMDAPISDSTPLAIIPAVVGG